MRGFEAAAEKNKGTRKRASLVSDCGIEAEAGQQLFFE